MGKKNRPILHSGSKFLKSVSVYWEKRLIFIFLMGFASGLPFLLTGATLAIWLTEAGVSLTAIGFFALVGTPYNFKYLWAPFIDRVPIPLLSRMLGRRRAWMLMIQAGLGISMGALGLSDPRSAPESTAIFALAVAFFSASQDIVIDAYRIEILDEDQHHDPGRLSVWLAGIRRRRPVSGFEHQLVPGLLCHGRSGFDRCCGCLIGARSGD